MDAKEYLIKKGIISEDKSDLIIRFENGKEESLANLLADYNELKSPAKTHVLKITPQYFDDVFKGLKDFEVRKNDRDFRVGDRIELKEYGEKVIFPRYLLKEIKYILAGGQYGIFADYVVLGLKNVKGR
jgi:hypothetical protein